MTHSFNDTPTDSLRQLTGVITEQYTPGSHQPTPARNKTLTDGRFDLAPQHRGQMGPEQN
ncbi:hypothetical protein E2C01_065495 [Portunus trituberculatus]|uniref:Uncharacterized protein n=1 Tax=Portunus trituberculatus TaxID=210409 RepID=A0A5B7HM15_PORTR|nr:hypothetical protein [Portunus trituberculatus]